MIVGETYTLDYKGRVVLPPHWRKLNPGPYVITLLPDGVVALLPQEAHEQLAAGATKFARDYLRMASTVIAGCDVTTGRVSVPVMVRRQAGWRSYEELLWLEWRGGLRLLPYTRWAQELAAREPAAREPEFPLPRAVREGARIPREPVAA